MFEISYSRFLFETIFTNDSLESSIYAENNYPSNHNGSTLYGNYYENRKSITLCYGSQGKHYINDFIFKSKTIGETSYKTSENILAKEYLHKTIKNPVYKNI